MAFRPRLTTGLAIDRKEHPFQCENFPTFQGSQDNRNAFFYFCTGWFVKKTYKKGSFKLPFYLPYPFQAAVILALRRNPIKPNKAGANKNNAAGTGTSDKELTETSYFNA